LAGISFTPAQIASEIQKHIPDFKISYIPDFRQAIANSWPQSILEDEAKKDWNWSAKYNLSSLVTNMLENLA
jgi:nucleoside-diphosphate-sugar epimerase